MNTAELHNQNSFKRQKMRDEGKKILKICVNKLQMIHDPESYLCKSVLINNTLKSIQQEHRELQRSRLKLKRQKQSYSDENENKKVRLEAYNESEEAYDPMENNVYDVTSHVATSDDESTNSINDLILCDTTTETAHVDIWYDAEEDDSSSDSDISDDSNYEISRTVDISIQPIDCTKHNSSDKKEHCNNTKFYSTNINLGEKLSNSSIHSVPVQT